METGRTAILLNLENLYESLYDVLNQYYITHGTRKYVDLGLQTHRVRCRVDNNFKYVMHAYVCACFVHVLCVCTLHAHACVVYTSKCAWVCVFLFMCSAWRRKVFFYGGSNISCSDSSHRTPECQSFGIPKY